MIFGSIRLSTTNNVIQCNVIHRKIQVIHQKQSGYPPHNQIIPRQGGDPRQQASSQKQGYPKSTGLSKVTRSICDNNIVKDDRVIQHDRVILQQVILRSGYRSDLIKENC